VEKNNDKSIEGKWTEEENLKYILFMDYHSKVFISKEKRKYFCIDSGLRGFSSLSAIFWQPEPRGSAEATSRRS